MLTDRRYMFKNYCLKCQSTLSIFFFFFFCFFCFTIYKMVDSECNMDINKSIKISIGTVMRNPKMLKFLSDHLKNKKNV